jgi:prevent-host-death family protein
MSKGKQRVAAADFKARCLKLMEEVARSGAPLVVTKRGKPLVELVAAAEEPRLSVFGCMRGTVLRGADDLLSTGERWNEDE